MRTSRFPQWAGLCLVIISLSACGADNSESSTSRASTPSSSSASSTNANGTGELTPEESQQKIYECILADGWDVKYDPVSQSIESRVSEGQTAAFDAKRADCERLYPPKIISMEDFTDADWESVYASESKAADCLRGQGVAVPSTPSIQVFRERYVSDDPWLAYDTVIDSGADVTTFMDECPAPGTPGNEFEITGS